MKNEKKQFNWIDPKTNPPTHLGYYITSTFSTFMHKYFKAICLWDGQQFKDMQGMFIIPDLYCPIITPDDFCRNYQSNY